MNKLTIYQDNEQVIKLVTDGLDSPCSRKTYRTALLAFFAWWEAESRPPLTKRLVQEYKQSLLARGLAASSINVALSAIRKLAVEATDNGLLDEQVANGVGRVKGVKRHGTRVGNWLSKAEAQAVLDGPDGSLKGKRDKALLAMFLGTGLRIAEITSLTFGHIQQREARWVIVDLLGKGNKVRTVPVPSWCKQAIDDWALAAGINEGRILRSVNKGGKVWGDGMTSIGIYKAVKALTGVAPHDLRRTWAKLAHKGGAALEQIMISLGHASIQTTETYLGVQQDLTNPPCDRLGLR